MVTNSVVFAQRVRDQPITEDEIMVSFNVVALFTSIPVDLALYIIRDKLQQDVTLTERTDISITNIVRPEKQLLHLRTGTLPANVWLCHGISHECHYS